MQSTDGARRRQTGKKYRHQRKASCRRIARRIEGGDPEEHGTQQTYGGNGSQATGRETHDCRRRLAKLPLSQEIAIAVL